MQYIFINYHKLMQRCAEATVLYLPLRGGPPTEDGLSFWNREREMVCLVIDCACSLKWHRDLHLVSNLLLVLRFEFHAPTNKYYQIWMNLGNQP